MAKNESEAVPVTVSEAIGAIAKALGVAAVELWSIFVRQYLVKGITEAFTGVVLCIAAWFLFPYISLWALVPLALALVFFYGAIQLIGNPKYYALDDIMGRVEKQKKDNDATKRYPFYV